MPNLQTCVGSKPDSPFDLTGGINWARDRLAASIAA